MMATKTDTGGKEVIDISSEVSATGDAGRSEGRSRRAPTSLKDPGSDASRKNELSENGKKKTKEEKPSTKVVIRRLPPTMTKDVFMSQISPIPDHDYFYFVQGDPISGPLMGFSRAYINFTNQEDLFRFTETYDNYVFVDTKGQEYPAMVEFALFQRIPKQRTKKKDQLSGCIETDPTYISFKESLEAAAADAAKPDAVSKQHFFETEVSVPSPQEESSTPLLEFLKQKRADRARVRDERREEKKRKEAERKLRQKATKERKESEEDQPKDIKLLQPKDRKDVNNKDNRGGRRSEKEKPPKENRSREFKSRNNKNSTDEKPRGEKKEEKKKDSVALERKEEKKELGEREPKGVINEKTEDTANAPTTDVLKGSTSEKKRNNGGPERRKGDGDAKEGDDPPKKSRSERNRSVRKERERKRRDDYLAKKNLEKKNSAEAGDRKRSRNFRNSAGDPVGNRKLSNETSKEEITEKEGNKSEGSSRLKTEDSTKENPHGSRESPTQTEIPDDKIFKRRSSLESKPEQEKPLAKDGASFKRRSSLESGGVSEYVEGKYRRERRRESGDKGKTMDDKRGAESDGGGEKTRSAVEDKASKSDQDDNKDNKDPRTGRRIRNKDRPSIQIYRPGMGKLSKQRLEKERTLGSSTEVDSPSHSPSPAPKAKPPPPPP